MSTKKEHSIQETVNSMQEMADLVLLQLSLIERVMIDYDQQKSVIEEINRNEKEIDRYEVLISDKFINTIVLYQPVASDLRKLVAVYRMTINLERIGDLVMNMTYALGTIGQTEEYKLMADVILNMFQSGKVMVEKSLLSFTNSDQDYAVWTIKNDDVIDEMNNRLLANAISKVTTNKKTREMLLSYIDIKNIMTNIERIADHATNIAEATIYSLKGTDVRHSGFEKDEQKSE